MKINGSGNWKLNVLGSVAIGTFLLAAGLRAESSRTEPAAVVASTSIPLTPPGWNWHRPIISVSPLEKEKQCLGRAELAVIVASYRDSQYEAAVFQGEQI
jgi:hypothetical protein